MKVEWKKIVFTKPDEWYSSDMESGTSFLSLQNKLMISQNFPSCGYIARNEQNKVVGDKFGSIRLNKTEVNSNFDFSKLKGEKLIELASSLVGEKVTGVRIVRYTDEKTNLPSPRLDYFIKDKETPQMTFEEIKKNPMLDAFDSFSSFGL